MAQEIITPQKDISVKQASLIAAISLLLMIVIAMFAETQRAGIVVEGDAAATWRNLSANTAAIRYAVIGYTLILVLDVVVAWSLYIFYRPVSNGLSLLAGWFRLAYAVMFTVAVFNLVDVLRIMDAGGAMADATQLQWQTGDLLQAYTYQWNFSFVFFGIHLFLLGILTLKAAYMPKWLGILLLIAGCGYAIDGFGKSLIPGYNLSLVLYTFIGEVLLMVWLFIKGRKLVQGTDL
jgi:hypothetical protein